MTSPFAGLPFSVPVAYQGAIELASQQYGIPASVLAAQINQESGFNPNARSSAGAEGIAQFEPGTAASVGLSNPFDPITSIMAMAKLDSQYVSEFGSLDLALAAYNAGPGAVETAGNQIPNITETQNYVTSILSAAGVSGSTGGDSGSTTSSTDVGSILSLTENLANPAFWGRVGKGAIAAGLIGGGIFFMVSKHPGTMKPIRELVNIP